MTSIFLLYYIKFFFNLFVLINPIGLIPVFISMTKSLSKKKINKINFISNFTASLILCTSLILGNFILNLFSISIQSFKISGGILISSFALNMINNCKKKKKKTKILNKDVGIIPLAIPLIAGPGAISSTILWSSQCDNFMNLFFSIIVIFSFALFCWILFRLSPFFINFLGKTGMGIISKIMGLLLMSLGMEFIVSGIKSVFIY
ncbi:YchE family NAAT transporter [Buchnera aphidicola]|uniref:YchE family NAAT transporter n=1 Tax=Buchnera aphidicola TaxID=9 RepID=UPI003464BD40